MFGGVRGASRPDQVALRPTRPLRIDHRNVPGGVRPDLPDAAVFPYGAANGAVTRRKSGRGPQRVALRGDPLDLA